MLLACLALVCSPVSVPAPAEIVGETAEVRLQVGRPLVLRIKADVHRTAVVAEGIVELSQFTPREISLVGRHAGTTTVTFWFRDPARPPVIYAVKVVDRPAP
jgi:Flp pilus assembly secretin CpaC